MAEYTLEWARAVDAQRILGELPIVNLSYSDILNAPGAVSGTIPLDPFPGTSVFTTDTFDAAKTVVYIRRDGVMMWGGLVWGVRASVADDTIAFDGEGWHSWTRRQLINNTLEFINDDQGEVAKALMDSILVQSNPFNMTAVLSNHGVNRTRTYYWWEGKNAGEALEQLSSVAGGFDYVYRTGDDYSTSFSTSYPAWGRLTTAVFEVGTNVELVDASTDGKGVTTRWVGFGSGQGATVLYHVAFGGDALSIYPLLQDVASLPDVSRLSTLQLHVDALIEQSTRPPRLVEVEHFPDAEPKLGSYDVGDIVYLTVQRGWLNIDRELYRIVSRTVTVDGDGGETVRLQLAPWLIVAR